MLLDFFKMVILPDHYRSTWRDGDFIVEFVPDTQDDVPDAETGANGTEAAALMNERLDTESAE